VFSVIKHQLTFWPSECCQPTDKSLRSSGTAFRRTGPDRVVNTHCSPATEETVRVDAAE